MSVPELTDNQQMIRETVRALAEKHFRPKAAEIDRARRPPVENIKLLAEHGFTGLFISEEYGGPGLGLLEIVLVIEELARCCANTALLAGSTEGAGAARDLLSRHTRSRRSDLAAQDSLWRLFLRLGHVGAERRIGSGWHAAPRPSRSAMNTSSTAANCGARARRLRTRSWYLPVSMTSPA